MNPQPRPPSYPEEWEADVVLRDGSTCHLRPITPEDGDELRHFYAQLSDETIFFRFFAPYPQLSARDLVHFTTVDHVDRVALLATIGSHIIGVVRYDRTSPEQAEVAFVIRDDHQGRGLGTVFLEHIAQAARERGVRRFVAEVLPNNIRMLEVFEHAGYRPQTQIDDGVVYLEFDIRPTDSSVAVSRARELRAEALSVRRLLTPRSVAVVGASRHPDSVGRALLDHVVNGGFTGTTYVVNPATSEVAGVQSYARLIDIPGGVDLALIAVPADGVNSVIDDAARSGVHGVLVVSAGFSDLGPAGFSRQQALVNLTRANGMRLVGPNALGLINTNPDVSLNASVSPVVPKAGRLGFFSQSGALGISLLDAIAQRGLGLSTFVSAGNRADISGNDLLQYWEEDVETDVVMLYLESIGNPRKFSRIARRLSRSKPIVAVRGGKRTQGVPLGEGVRESLLSDEAVEQMFRQSGVIRTTSVAQMFDVAQLVATQPLPQGDRTVCIGNSNAMLLLAVDALLDNGLIPIDPTITFSPDVAPQEFEQALAGAADDPAVDAIVTMYVPGLKDDSESIARVFGRVAERSVKPLIAVMFAPEGFQHMIQRVVPGGAADLGSVPTYPAVEDAARALGAVTRYAKWRQGLPEEPVDPEGVDVDRAQALVTEWLLERPQGGELDHEQCQHLLACYGVLVQPRRICRTVEEAVAAAAEFGYPIVLKTVDSHLRLRSDLGGIYFDIDDEADLRHQFQVRLNELRPLSYDRLVVQHQAPPGAAVVIETCEDPLFGPAMSFGVAGVAYDVLSDRSYGIPPLTNGQIQHLIRQPKASRLLQSDEAGNPLDLTALSDLIARIARIADDLPEMSRLTLRPIVVSTEQTSVLGAQVHVNQPTGRIDQPARRLLG